jgi:hypothetical protein
LDAIVKGLNVFSASWSSFFGEDETVGWDRWRARSGGEQVDVVEVSGDDGWLATSRPGLADVT